MYKEIKYEEIIENKLKSDYILVDCRSPFEYEEDSLPDSINLPIFDDEERIAVGTLYKQDSVEKARELGIEIVSRKLPSIYKYIVALKKEYKSIIFYCSKGGYRSTSLVSLLDAIGHKNIYKLDGGYKEYRKFVNKRLLEEIKEIELIVLYGNTGSGKTKLLKELEKNNLDVIDLEGFANHRGSTLGAVGLGHQNSQKKFETLLLDKLLKRKSNLIFTEGESKRIGKVLIPEEFFDKILNGYHLKIVTDINLRIEIILEDYVNKHDDEIIEALNFLRKRLSNDSVDKYIESVKNNNYKFVIEELMINYYDPMYEHNKHNYIKEFYNDDIYKTTENIIEWYEENKKRYT